MRLLGFTLAFLSLVVGAIHGANIRTKIGSVAETKDGQMAVKTLSMISFPKVPEFPKIGSRPGGLQLVASKPASTSASMTIPSTSVSSIPSNNQQQLQQGQTHSLNNSPQQQPSPNYHVQEETPPATLSQSVENPPLQTPSESVVETLEVHIPSENVAVPLAVDPFVVLEVAEPENGPLVLEPAGSAEKIQPDISTLEMPLQVMNILNALGTGGSLVQASKPEKDGAGHVTANAIGYASGQDSKVDALVSNILHMSNQGVTITDSAQASASSAADGAAFAQATLNSNGIFNGWGGQLGGGGGWGGWGNGWQKVN